MDAVRSVSRSLDILDLLAEGPRGLGAVAREVGLPKTTAYRLLLTLEQRGIVSRDEGPETFRLGPRLLYLGLQARAGDSLHAAALPTMRELRQRFGETVNLNVRVGDERLCIASVEGVYSVRMTGVLGQRSPLHSGAAARALLAFLPEEAVDRYIDSNLLEPVTSQTITDPTELRAALRTARELGYVVSHGERSPGVTSLGAPVWNVEGELVASVNLSGPSERMAQHPLEELGRAVAASGLAISSALGYGPRAAVANDLEEGG
jgi:DNA-binding IclR family transcriptional regulator